MPTPASLEQAVKYLNARRSEEISVEFEDKRRAKISAQFKKKNPVKTVEKKSADPEQWDEYKTDKENRLAEQVKRRNEKAKAYREKNREKKLLADYEKRMSQWEEDTAKWKAGLLPEMPRKPFMRSQRVEGERDAWKEEWTLRKRREKLGT